MKKVLLALIVFVGLLNVGVALAQSLQSGTIGGMPYDLLPASGGCSAATPCSVVTYLGYQDETSSATASDLQNYFGGAFAQANPHTIVIAPMLTQSQDSSYNWGGYDAVANAETAQMVAVVQGIEQSMGNTVNTADSVVTGGSLGGDGTQSALIAYGPKGTVQPGVFDAGLSFDAATYAAAGNAQDIAALCGVPLIAVHGTADTNQSVTYDESLQSTIDSNAACGNSFDFIPIQGAGHGTWSGPDGYSAGVGPGTPLGDLTSDIQVLSGRSSAAVATATPAAPTATAAPPVATPVAATATATPAAAAPAQSANTEASCTVPGPASAAGYTDETFGAPLTVGTTPNPQTSYPQFTNGANVVPFDFYGTSWTQIGETNSNGSVTLNGSGEAYGNGVATASTTPQGTLNGVAFGGGGYFQVTMAGNGPMSFWMNDAEKMNSGSIGAPDNNPSWVEADIAEFDTTGVYGFAIHNWQSDGNSNGSDSGPISGSPVSVPGANYNQPNNYGFLWVPATATTQGSAKFFFNGQQVGNTITWNQYVPGQSAPSNPFAVMDALHMVPILGAGPGTTATFSNLQVWQASGANDIGTGAAAAAAAQPCTGGETTTPATPVATAPSSTIPTPTASSSVPASAPTTFSAPTTIAASPSTISAPAAAAVAGAAAPQASTGPLLTATPANPAVALPAATVPAMAVTSCPALGGGDGTFKVSGGQIIGPNGQPFIARGINMSDSDMGDAQAAIALFPGLNFVRLAIYSYQDPSAYAAFISTMTANGTVVEIEHHVETDGSTAGGGQGGIASGAWLAAENAFYASVAQANAGNPYVWFGTTNEPPTEPGLSEWQEATVNAIRGAGNNSIIMLEIAGWPGGWQTDMDPGVYASMTNVVWDTHYYGWVSGYSTDQTTVNQALAAEIAGAQTITSADGTVPALIGEYGPSTTGESLDANSTQNVEAVIDDGVAGTAGSAAWHWGQQDCCNNLNNGGSMTSPYGQTVALYINTNVVPLTQCQENQQAAQAINAAQATASAAPSTSTTTPTGTALAVSTAASSPAAAPISVDTSSSQTDALDAAQADITQAQDDAARGDTTDANALLQAAQAALGQAQ